MRLYYNGTVLPNFFSAAEALIEKNGKMLFCGSEAEARGFLENAEYHDLAGRTLMPSFLDAHGHFTGYADSLMHPSLENATTLQEITQRLLAFLESAQPEENRWITAGKYDSERLFGELPSKPMLDKISPLNPCVIQHVSGHSGVFNSRALSLVGKSESITGRLEEKEYFDAVKHIPLSDESDLLYSIKQAESKYLAQGITTVQEGMVVEQLTETLKTLADRDLLNCDLVAYSALENAESAYSVLSKEYCGKIRLGGVKIFLDGSPQSKTAWMKTPYLGGGYGKPTLTDSEVCAALKFAESSAIQLLAHCNGDAACEQFLNCSEKLGIKGYRNVIIHAQLITPEQLKRAAKLGIITSFFASHVYHFGDTHIRNFGYDRAKDISPLRAAELCGIPFTLHCDSPVIEPNIFEAVQCAVLRETEGKVKLNEEQCINVASALTAVTQNAAFQYFEESAKGVLRTGKNADMIIVDKNPLAIPPEELKTVRVVQTIKDGKGVLHTKSEAAV